MPGGVPLSSPGKGLALGLAASLSWGTVFLCGRYLSGLHSVDPLLVSAARFSFATFALLLYVTLTGHGPRLLAAMQDAPRFFLLGLLGVVGLGVFVFTSTQYTYSINGVLIMNSNGVFIAALAFLVGEKVPPSRYIGLVVGLAGCILVAASSGSGLALGGQNDLLGCILALGGALSWALYTLWGKQPTLKWGGLVATTASISIGAAIMSLIVIIRKTELLMTWQELLVVAYVALVPTALGFVCWYAAMEHVPANLIGPLQYVAPVIGIMLGALLLHEPLRIGFVAGALLVFCGVWIATLWSSKAGR